jgi:2-C-methyl-D-erythritol 4-phosphate cytidylyltransferase
MNKIKTSAIIVGAGKGTRMGGVDKLLLTVAGHPVIYHTLTRFDLSEFIEEIILVVREDNIKSFEDFLKNQNFTKPVRLVIGGALRQDSVWNGINAVSAGIEVVSIHDGARPCVSLDIINRTIQIAQEFGAAVAAKRVIDTIKESLDGLTISGNIDRSKLWAVQTPQTFRLDIIRRAMLAVREKGLIITDDTAACEVIGVPVRLIEDPNPNPKLTLQSDIPYIEFLLSKTLK